MERWLSMPTYLCGRGEGFLHISPYPWVEEAPPSSLICHLPSLPLSSPRTASTVSVVAFLASTMSTDSQSC